jgi:hypothetical protein
VKDAKAGSLRLEGEVLTEGQPVVGATVWLDSESFVVCDDAGRFVFADLAPGLYRLAAHKEDLYADTAIAMVHQGRGPTVLSMSLGITLRIHVMDGGSPVAGARILGHKELVGVTDTNGLAVVRG